jgi:hypothetical protein
MRILKRIAERALLAFSGMLPGKLMAHYMFLLRNHPEITDDWGYHIRSIHYYEPLPDFRKLTAVRLGEPRICPAIDFRLSEQRALLERLGATCHAELAVLCDEQKFDFHNSYFAGFDAAAYYALIRDLKPRKVVEIGSGFSTRIAAAALARNGADAQPGELICIEPFPEPRLTQSGVKFKLIEKTVQQVDPCLFEQLEENDILFIDSSHVACAGSDVITNFFSILPKLKRGVWIHIHDIFFPTDYPAEWLMEKRIAFNEQYVLEAFLSYNSAFGVRLSNHWIAIEYPDAVGRLCPNRIRGRIEKVNDASSLWMRKETDVC